MNCIWFDSEAECENKELQDIIEKLFNYKDSVISIESISKTVLRSETQEISIGIGYHNGVNNKFEIIITRSGYDMKVKYQQWKSSFSPSFKALDRVTFPVPNGTSLTELIPKNENFLLSIIDEFRYKSEFETRTYQELQEILCYM